MINTPPECAKPCDCCGQTSTLKICRNYQEQRAIKRYCCKRSLSTKSRVDFSYSNIIVAPAYTVYNASKFIDVSESKDAYLVRHSLTLRKCFISSLLPSFSSRTTLLRLSLLNLSVWYLWGLNLCPSTVWLSNGLSELGNTRASTVIAGHDTFVCW